MSSRNFAGLDTTRPRKKKSSISNFVKPSKAPITLPGEIKPTYQAIAALHEEIRLLRIEKFGLEKQVGVANRAAADWRRKFEDLRTRAARFLADENSGAA